METIWKFPLELGNEQYISIPNGYTPLWVAVQDRNPYLWCRVDTEKSMVKEKILIYGTGHPLSNNTGKHLGSFMLYDSLVFHVFSEA
jgi:hypothetical protein